MSSTFNDLLIEIGINTKPAYDKIRQLDKAFNNLGKTFSSAVQKNAPKDPFNLDIQKAKIKQAIDTNKKLTKETSKVNKSAKESAKIFKDSFKEQEKANKKLSQSQIAQNNRLQQQKILKQQLDKLGIKPKYDPLDSIAKQNTALRRQITNYERLEKQAKDAATAIRMSSGYQQMSVPQQSKVEQRISRAQSDFRATGDRNHFKALNKDVNSFKRSLIGLQTVQMGLTDSTRNMVRAYASLFALVEGTAAIKNVGMDFESMRASMLAASSSQEDATKKLGFVRQEARRLGVDLVAASKAFTQLSIAGKGVIEEDQIKDLFVSSMEAATAFGMSLDDTKGTFRAFIQIK